VNALPEADSASDIRPWRRYHRRKPRPDFSYPVKQTEVLEALRSQEATIGELIFWWWVGEKEGRDKSDAHRLLKAEWTGSDTQLWVYAVPVDRKRAAHAGLTEAGLRRAAAWLREAPTRGNVWTASRRQWTAVLTGDELQFAENMQPKLSE
jgi:hypothetical protein